MRFRETLERWEAEYDYLIIDSAPVLSVSDSIPVATWADSVLIVARFHVTPIKALLRTRNVLARANAKIHGIVLNGADDSGEEYYYGRYNDGYYNEA
jgi:tyrosine-protein kinase Etk/Wzc